VGFTYFLSERARRAPWGRVLRAIRENEPATRAAGKNVMRFRLEAFVLGAAVMGVGGALYAHYTRFVGPLGFTPLKTTFLIWVMLIAGGSGNNRGAILGAFAVWGIWSGTDLVASQFPAQLAPRISPARILLIGVLLQVVLLTRPQGILPERPPKPVVDASGAD